MSEIESLDEPLPQRAQICIADDNAADEAAHVKSIPTEEELPNWPINEH